MSKLFHQLHFAEHLLGDTDRLERLGKFLNGNIVMRELILCGAKELRLLVLVTEIKENVSAEAIPDETGDADSRGLQPLIPVIPIRPPLNPVVYTLYNLAGVSNTVFKTVFCVNSAIPFTAVGMWPTDFEMVAVEAMLVPKTGGG
jgi:hypothetical protein